MYGCDLELKGWLNFSLALVFLPFILVLKLLFFYVFQW